MSLKVLLADDHSLSRPRLRQLLADENPQYELAEAEGFDAVRATLAERGGDLLLIGLGIQGMAGADGLRALREAFPATRIVVIAPSDDRATILQCLGAGVHGYILKTSPLDELHHAIATILAGGVYVVPSLAEVGRGIAPLAPDAGTAAMPRFTARQLDVLHLLAQGRSATQIARHLELRPGTVKIHLAAIFRTLNVRSRNEAVELAAKLNL
jgi:DNA-binding NarL/FixJ family response regulator